MRLLRPVASSAGFLRTFFLVALVLSLFHAWGVYVFLTNPSALYFRAWEFTDEITFKTADFGNVWSGPEQQDLTRKNVLFYNTGRQTTVTVDDYGNRQTVSPTDTFSGILVAGDSQAWGSGLSDAETIASRLSVRLDALVPNLSRQALCAVTQNPLATKGTTILLIITERHLGGYDLFNYKDCPAKDDRRPLERPLSRFDLLKLTDPVRYSYPLRAYRALKTMGGDIKTLLSGGPKDKLFYDYNLTEQDMAGAVKKIQALSSALESQGINLVVMPIPTKLQLYSPDASIEKKEYLGKFYKLMQENNIDYVDVQTPFKAHIDELIYFPYDTHIAPLGADIAAETAAQFFTGKQAL